MTTKSTLSHSVPALMFVFCAAAALAVPTTGAHAQDAPVVRAEESVREKVERLLPEFMSDSETARDRAEKEIVALGDPARAELDRLTRDTDPQKAIAALKLLQSKEWERRAARDADAPGSRRPRVIPLPPVPEIDLRKFQDDVDRQMDELRQTFDDWRKQIDADDWMPGFEARGGSPSTEDEPRGSSSGHVVENGRSLEWSIDAAGKVRVTTRDGAGSQAQVFEAPSLSELRKQHPDVAKRLDGFLPSRGLRRWTLVWPPRASWNDADRKQGADTPARDDGRGAAPRDPGLRDGEQRLTPAERVADAQPSALGPVLGITWGDVPEVLRDQLGIEAGGLVVTTVAPESLAAKLGLRRNDVLLSLGGRAISNPADIRRALEADGAPKAEATVLIAEVLRKGRRESLTATR